MQVFIRTLALTFALGILAIALGLFSTHPAGAAGSAPVMVTNTPLPVQGTVNAAQSGPWNVGVTGTPNVNIANAPNVNIGTLPAVQLASGTTVGISGTPSVNVNSSATSPHGFVTVIESISGELRPPGDLPPSVTFEVIFSNPQGGQDLLFPGKLLPIPPGGNATYSFHERTQLYVDPDRTIELFASGTGPFSSARTAGMTITGRLLPCPLPSAGLVNSCGTSHLIKP
ncbi:MAG: hypothetical protein DMG43_07520 [Acidobacteria bacterium]|nr:MAG: hypothetical protein DMG43_07520 [Acidobacteriota bacterium]